MSLGETFTINGGNDDDGELSDSMSAALARRFPSEESTSDDAGVPTPVVEDVDGVVDGSSPTVDDPAPPAPDPSEEPVVEAAGGPGDVPVIDPPTDGFLIADAPDPDPAAVVAPDPVAATGEDLDLNDLFTRWTGRKPTSTEMVNLFGFIDQISALSPEQNAQLQAILAGQPAPGPASAPSPFGQPAPIPIPTPTALPIPTLPDDIDPAARALLEPLYSKITELEATTHAQQVQSQQAQLAAQQAQYAQAAQVASQQFVSQYGPLLSPTDLVLLETKAARSGQIQFFLSQSNGDMTRAYHSMLEATMLADPSMRQRVMSAQQTQEAAQAAADAKRIQLASAVSGGGTPATPTPAPPSKSSIDQSKGLRAGSRTKAELAQATREASARAAKDIAELTGMQSAPIPPK